LHSRVIALGLGLIAPKIAIVAAIIKLYLRHK